MALFLLSDSPIKKDIPVLNRTNPREFIWQDGVDLIKELNGIKEITYKVKYQNEVEIERTKISEVVIQEPVVIEEPTPEIAPTSEVQVLDNYEITLPEEQKAIEVSQNMSEQNIEKGPMFVTDTPVVEQPVVVETTPEPIAIDVPEIEEIQ